MDLLSQITQRYKDAMKERKEPEKTVLNFILAQLKNKKIEIGRDLLDEEILAVFKKEVKATKESIAFIQKANKLEDLEIENQKLDILLSYLPQLLSKEETQAIVLSCIATLGVSDVQKERGKIMEELMKEYRGKIDGSLVNEILHSLKS